MMSFEAIVAILWAVVLGLGGALLTKIDAWYFGLRKPSWQPPDWLFGPAWTIILGFAAWAFVLAWRETGSTDERTILLALYAINGVFHILWSPLFFTAKRPDWALLEVPLLWLSVLALAMALPQWSTFAGLLVVPYLLWVSFAAVLNWKIVKLNPPFGRGAEVRRSSP